MYASAWLKCHHPGGVRCALLNAQPMGFYAPAQMVRDAREHGVSVCGVDVEASDWDSAIEDGGALRLGFRIIGGFRQDWAEMIVAARLVRGGRFGRFAALAQAGLPRPALEALAEADAMRNLRLDRREALWQVRGLSDAAPLPLFADLPVAVRPADLPLMRLPEHVVADYQSTGLSLKAHPLTFMRAALMQDGAMTCAEIGAAADGTRATVAGVVLVRQRPGSAGGVVFATIEDETGIANIVVWASLIERFRREIVGSALLEVAGKVQRSREGVVHVVAERLRDRTAELRRLDGGGPPAAPADGTRVGLPRSRDFH